MHDDVPGCPRGVDRVIRMGIDSLDIAQMIAVEQKTIAITRVGDLPIAIPILMKIRVLISYEDVQHRLGVFSDVCLIVISIRAAH